MAAAKESSVGRSGSRRRCGGETLRGIRDAVIGGVSDEISSNCMRFGGEKTG